MERAREVSPNAKFVIIYNGIEIKNKLLFADAIEEFNAEMVCINLNAEVDFEDFLDRIV